MIAENNFLRDRLMVGHRPLEASILVRVQAPQPSFRIRFFAKIRRVANGKKGVWGVRKCGTLSQDSEYL